MARCSVVMWRSLAACVLVSGLAVGVDCMGKEKDDKKPAASSFGSFGSSGAAKKADPPPAAPVRQAERPTPQPAAAAPAAAPAAQQRRQESPPASQDQGVTKAAVGASPAFGQFGSVKKIDQNPSMRTDGGATAAADGREQAARKGSATDMALERAAAQAQALRTLDARRNGAVPAAIGGASVDRAGADRQQTAGTVRGDGRVGAGGAGGSNVGTTGYDASKNASLPLPSAAQSQGPVYVERSGGLSDLATGVLIGRATRPTVIVRDSGSNTDWGGQSMSVDVPPSVSVATNEAPVNPVQEKAADVVAHSSVKVDRFPWGTLFGLVGLGLMAAGVVVWMTQARPAQKKRYSL